MSAPVRYTRAQIALHWLIVILVAVQFLTAEAMEEFFDKAEDAGVLAGFPTESGAIAHALGGGLILALMFYRLWLRWSYGAPLPPANMKPILQLAARVTHAGFYVLLVLLPLTGAAALYINSEAGDVHGAIKSVLIPLIAVHVAGAVVHAFVYKDDVLRRMMP
jgi:cytochrome b561